MNANEMADALAEVPIEIFGKVRMIDVRTMLRQQAKEIEMLRQGMKDGFDGLETMTALSKAQADQITRLKLEWQYMYDRANMESTSEPVAWMDKDTLDATHIIKAVVRREQDEQHTIPLYTTPQKYCPSENNAAYEKGFIEGMAKQRDSKVQQFVEAYVNKEDGLVCAKCYKPFEAVNNKPVAWMDEETGCFVYSQYEYEDLDEHGKDGLIPLYTHPVKEQDDYCKAYWGNNNKFVDVFLPNSETEVIRFWNNTHPVKELTDEEILKIWRETPINEYNSTQQRVCDFARAILRKAQEK